MSCGGTTDSACVKAAKESRDLSRKIADDKWEDAQYKISKISDRDLRLMQRTNSSDIRTAKYEQADAKFQQEKLKCDEAAKSP